MPQLNNIAINLIDLPKKLFSPFKKRNKRKVSHAAAGATSRSPSPFRCSPRQTTQTLAVLHTLCPMPTISVDRDLLFENVGQSFGMTLIFAANFE